MIWFCLFLIFASVTGESRIYGGQNAEEGQFPFAISIKQNGSLHCGGTIINKRWILTAGHCVWSKDTSQMKICVGSSKLNNQVTEFNILSSKVHEDFDFYNEANDVAVIEVDRDIEFNDKIQPISLNSDDIGAGEELVLVGWGYTNISWIVPNDLQFITLKSISFKQCEESLDPQKVYETEICTLTKKNEGACYGDSGSALIYKNTVAGIVSWGRPCAIGYPDVFTRVSSFYSWIKKNIN